MGHIRERTSEAQGRAAQASPSNAVRDSQFVNLEELVDAYLDAFEQKVIQKLSDLEATEFEQFAGVLISSYGFTNVIVTKKSKDGGIDGHGELKVGLATLKAAFQCKKWKGTVGSPDIDGFSRGHTGEI
jgi:restriction system protein